MRNLRMVRPKCDKSIISKKKEKKKEEEEGRNITKCHVSNSGDHGKQMSEIKYELIAL